MNFKQILFLLSLWLPLLAHSESHAQPQPPLQLQPQPQPIEQTTAPVPMDADKPGLFDWFTNLPADWSIWAGRVTSPQGLAWTGGLTAATLGLISTDYETWQETKRWGDHSHFVHRLYQRAEVAGQGISQFALSAAFLTYGMIANDNRALRTTSQIVEAIAATSAIVQLGKHVTGRQSPFKATSRTGTWDVFPDQVKYSKNVQAHDAVPSGHIATAQTTATVIVENYPHVKWLPFVAYPAVAWVGFGLVGTSIHWWSDIPFGVAIGYSMAKVVTRKNRPPDTAKDDGPFFEPMWSSDGEPLLSLRWNL